MIGLRSFTPRRGLPARRFPTTSVSVPSQVRRPCARIVVSPALPAAYESEGLPNRLLNAREVAKFVGCHEETVRRAYGRGLLRSQRFGVRGRRFHPEDVVDWICRGAPTKSS
mgnify:CR=1 FL=1